MSSEVSIRVKDIGKCYQIYENPADRLKQMLVSRLPFLKKKLYREYWALRNVSFEVRRGETFGLIGRNGSGKSTLLQMICGTLNPSEGSVTVNGRVAALLELGSGFNPEFTGRENVFLNAAVLGLTHEQIVSRFVAIENFADIGEFIEQPVKTYSSGMMVRLAFAVIAHVDADILIIDEALAVGDAFFTKKCMGFLRNFMLTGTVLFVSHDTGSIQSLCDRAGWLEKGRLIEMGEPKYIAQSYLKAFYEVSQNTTGTHLARVAPKVLVPEGDQRMAFINSTPRRNDIQVERFNPQAPGFGEGLAKLTSVSLHDQDGQALAWVVGGEAVSLRIKATVSQALHAPIMGFYLQDKLGQCLFGDNSFIETQSDPLTVLPDQTVVANFHFTMPRLAKGDYSIGVAIATGTQDEHIQQHWMHDALMLRSESTSAWVGMIGIPMSRIELGLEAN